MDSKLPLRLEPVQVGSYVVTFVEDRAALATCIVQAVRCGKYIIITDTNVGALYAASLVQSLQSALAAAATAAAVHVYTIAAGEASKSRATKAAIEDWMFGLKCHRDTCLIALGGGVVGDLTGFVAATYMRGIRYIHIPTSLLAAVDSSIGGKTGIDTPAGKNLLGAFYPPKAVLIDLSFLRTLPKRELSNGMAECLKAGAIRSSALWTALESSVERVMACDLSVIGPIVRESVAIKAAVVLADERESDVRAILNFGHSVGHAIEALLFPALLHGECVSIGMIIEAELACARGLLDWSVVRRLESVCQSYGLPTAVPKQLTASEIVEKMEIDKKNISAGQTILKKIVMLTSIGTVLDNPWTTGISDIELFHALSRSIAIKPSSPAALATPTAAAAAAPVRMQVPGSKSVTNRVLLMAALGHGTCRLYGVLHSDDTTVMMNGLRQLGVKIAFETERAATATTADSKQPQPASNETVVVVTGCGGVLRAPTAPLFLNNAGTAARFLTSVVTLCEPPGSTVTLTGNDRMNERPIGDLVDALKATGVAVKFLRKQNCLPLAITSIGRRGWGEAAGGVCHVSAATSSQYTSSLLLTAPYAGVHTIDADASNGVVVSEPYIAMTIELMRRFGVSVTAAATKTGRTFTLPKAVADSKAASSGAAALGYSNPTTFHIEGDASSATYLLAIAAVTGRSVTVTNVGSGSTQGDAKFALLLKQMGCVVAQDTTSTTLTGPANGALRGIESVDLADMTDSFMTLAAVASVASGTTRITNIANQRVKECNRLAVMANRLTQIGVSARELSDGLEIVGLTATPAATAALPRIDCADDHRIAMSFAVLACVSNTPYRPRRFVIDDRRCVQKTYPEFWYHLSHHLKAEFDPSGYATSAVANVPHTADSKLASTQTPPAVDSDVTIVLIGMRGAGKTSCGENAARQLGLAFIDLDRRLEQRLLTPGTVAAAGSKPCATLAEWVASHSWAEFRAAELEELRAALQLRSKPQASATVALDGASQRLVAAGRIIACGGGIIETAAAVELLQSASTALNAHSRVTVVQIARHIDDITAYLTRDKSRVPIDTPIAELWARRQPLYLSASSFTFSIPRGCSDWPLVNAGFVRWLSRVSGLQPVSIPTHVPTFFVCLTYPDVRHSLPKVTELTRGADAVELRVDLLRDSNDSKSGLRSGDEILDQLALLRLHTPLPVIFTVRSVSQGGQFPNEEETKIVALLHSAIRAGCEFVDLELCLSEASKQQLIRSKRASKIILSQHSLQREPSASDSDISGWFERCLALGGADVIKIVTSATTERDAYRLIELAASVRSRQPNPKSIPPFITLAMGARGKLSRVLNQYLTPVTHELLPSAAAPGQMTVQQIQAARASLGVLDASISGAKHYYLFGTPISASPSPRMHNAGFHQIGWTRDAHVYQRFETADIAAVDTLLLRTATPFGGANVTVPLKEQVFARFAAAETSTPTATVADSKSDSNTNARPLRRYGPLSYAARTIGAVNTIGVVPSAADDSNSGSSVEVLFGDNTDWIGIVQPLIPLLPPRIERKPHEFGVVIGAGGTARAALYALQQFGFSGSQLLVHNPRTHAKADALSKHFHCTALHTLTRDVLIQHCKSPDAQFTVIVNTLPASVQFTADTSIVNQKPLRPVLFDVNYLPATGSPLVQQFRAAAVDSKSDATTGGGDASRVVTGIHMLYSQGVAGFERWTGRSTGAAVRLHLLPLRAVFQLTWCCVLLWLRGQVAMRIALFEGSD